MTTCHPSPVRQLGTQHLSSLSLEETDDLTSSQQRSAHDEPLHVWIGIRSESRRWKDQTDGDEMFPSLYIAGG